MKTKITAMALLLGLSISTACAAVRNTTEIEPRCTSKEDRVMFAQMIIQCSAAANTKSDEEGEDVVEQCEVSIRKALCPEMARKCTTDADGYNKQCNEWAATKS